MITPRWADGVAQPQGGSWQPFTLENVTDAWQAELRQRPGSIIPLANLAQSTSEMRTDSLTLLLCIDSDGKARGQLYEDDGDGFSYLSGNYRQLTFEATLRKRVLTVTLRQTAGTMPPVNRVLRVAYVKNGKMRYSSWQQGNEIVVKMK